MCVLQRRDQSCNCTETPPFIFLSLSFFTLHYLLSSLLCSPSSSSFHPFNPVIHLLIPILLLFLLTSYPSFLPSLSPYPLLELVETLYPVCSLPPPLISIPLTLDFQEDKMSKKKKEYIYNIIYISS